VLRWEGRCEEAIPEYKTALDLNPNWLNSADWLAGCQLLTGSIDEAITLEERVIRLSPRDPSVGNFYVKIGVAHLLRSRADEAIVWLEKARDEFPKVPYTRGWLASAYGLKGETGRASVELAEARRLASGDDRFSSVAKLRAAGVPWSRNGYWGVSEVQASFEATYIAGLRKAGMPEE
jgi:tetratricopeptide (TPR) repeat protein